MQVTSANATNRLLRVIQSPFQSLLTISSLDGADSISAPFSYQLKGALSQYCDIDNTLYQPVSLHYQKGLHQPFFNGIITHIDYERVSNNITITLSAKIALLKNTRHSRVFENTSLLEISKALLSRHHIHDADFSQVEHDNKAIDFYVQFNESDFDLLERLWHNAGWFYYFSHSAYAHTMIFHNNTQAIASKKMVNNPNHSHINNTIFDSQQHIKLNPCEFISNDYNPYNIDKDEIIDKSLQTNSQIKLDHFQYPSANYFSTLPKPTATLETKTNDLTLALGCKIQFKQRDFLLTKRQFSIANNATVHNAKLTLKALNPDYQKKTILEPQFDGLHNAIITGIDGDFVDMDSHARVKVQFLWDQDSNHDEHSSCWIRVGANSASNQSGHFFIPRIGQEVFVAFQYSRGYRPVIIGTAYNSVTSTQFDLQKNPYINEISSRSFSQSQNLNALIFDETPASPKLSITSTRDFSLLSKGNHKKNIGKHQQCRIIEGNLSSYSTQGKQKIFAHRNIIFQVGSSEIRINAESIDINAKQIHINAKG